MNIGLAGVDSQALALYAVAVLESQQRPPPNAEQLEWPICLDENS